MAAQYSEEQPLPPREWLEELKRNNPDPDPDNSLYCAKLQIEHMGKHNHNVAVRKISKQVAGFYESNQHFRIYHGSTNSTRRTKFDPKRMVDTSSLNHILEVDKENMTALVEPNVPMDLLVSHLQPYGLVPPVVMEFPGITVGGGFAGTSGESSSFKYGFFDKTVQKIEIVLGDGTVIWASEKENADLFEGAAGSFGTLGVVTALELKLVKSSFWVELKYYPVTSVSEALETIQEKAKDEEIDYLDGILYSASQGVIITGRRHNERSLNGQSVERFTRAHDPWFYLHASQILHCSLGCSSSCPGATCRCQKNNSIKLPPTPSGPAIPSPTNSGPCTSSPFNQAMAPSTKKQAEPYTDHTPLSDYLFRYDRGAFWTGRYAFTYFLVPFNWFTRLVLDYFMHTRVMYQALHESGQSDLYIIQDLAIPISRTQEFLGWLDGEFGLFPLWLCPLKPLDTDSFSFHPKSGDKEEMLINIGLWGPGPRSRSSFVAKNRLLEAKVRELGGMKWLYAQAYYPEDEFWGIYDKNSYDRLRRKWKAERLPNVWDKVCTPMEDRRSRKRKVLMAIWPLSGLYGVARTLVGREYLLGPGGRGGLWVVLAVMAVLLGVWWKLW